MGTGIHSGCSCLKGIGHEFDIRESDLLSSVGCEQSEGVRKRRKGRPIATKHRRDRSEVIQLRVQRLTIWTSTESCIMVHPSGHRPHSTETIEIGYNCDCICYSKTMTSTSEEVSQPFPVSTSSPTAASMPRFSFSSASISRPLLTLSVKPCL
jgi:hypothetical protein